MGSKQYKIKRYKNIYGGGGGFLKAALIVVAVVLLCIALWAVYKPIYHMIKDKINEEDVSVSEEVSEESEISKETSSEASEESTSSEVSEESESSMEASSEEESSKEESSEASEEESSEEAPAVPSQMMAVPSDGGVFVPRAILNDSAQLDAFLGSLKEKGCTSAVVECKNAMGEVLYLSDNETAISSLAIVGDAFDAKKVSKAIKNAGLVPVAKIHGFRDGLAASANNEIAVKYYDTSYIWLDNASELGGRGWLNPYSSEAVNYIGSLAGELIASGFREVIVDSVHYPLGVGRDKIGYGDVEDDKFDTLSYAMNKIERMATEKGGRVSFVLNPYDYEGDMEMVYGGDILRKREYSYTVTASVDNIGSVQTTLDKINSMEKKADIILLSYTYDGSQATTDKLNFILSELKKNNVGSIYLFNPQGIY